MHGRNAVVGIVAVAVVELVGLVFLVVYPQYFATDQVVLVAQVLLA
jgi:hypothetical protein